MKKRLVVLMSMIMAFALAACGGSSDSGDSAGEEAAANISVVIEIDYPDESGAEDVEDAAVEIPEGGSALDALNAYGEANDCEIVMDDSSDTPFVTSIGGVAMTDTAGWVYELNDETVMESADACILNADDEVSWSFETWGE